MTTHVIYHHPCPDGTAAALAAWLALGDTANYHGMGYSSARPSIPPDADVVFVDFSLPRAELEALADRVRSVTVLDHHKTAKADLEGFPGAKFDMNKSGCVLAWEHFHPGKSVPLMFELIQDRDLWRWAFGNQTKAFAAFLTSVPLTIKSLHGVYLAMQDPCQAGSIAEKGLAILDVEKQQVERLCRGAFWVELGGHRFIATNAPIHQSEVANQLLQPHPLSPFAAAFVQVERAQRWSLRSRGDFDVSAVAAGFGGGGHAAAAGFTLATPV